MLSSNTFRIEVSAKLVKSENKVCPLCHHFSIIFIPFIEMSEAVYSSFVDIFNYMFICYMILLKASSSQNLFFK